MFAEVQLKRIQDKLQVLLKQYAVLQKENQQMKEELSRTNLQSVQNQKNIDELKQQVNVLKLTAGEMNDTDKKELEKRLNTYLKEIDRCIALLGE